MQSPGINGGIPRRPGHGNFMGNAQDHEPSNSTYHWHDKQVCLL